LSAAASNWRLDKARLVISAVERLLIRLARAETLSSAMQPDSGSELFRIDTCSAIAAGLGAVDLIRAADFRPAFVARLRAGEPVSRLARHGFEAAQNASPGARPSSAR